MGVISILPQSSVGESISHPQRITIYEMQTKPKNEKESMRKGLFHHYLLVDGQNLIRYPKGHIQIKNLEIFEKWVEENNIFPVVLFPSYSCYTSKIKKHRYVFFIDNGKVDDQILLESSACSGINILSNDGFRDYEQEFPKIVPRKVYKFAFLNNEFLTSFNPQKLKKPISIYRLQSLEKMGVFV